MLRCAVRIVNVRVRASVEGITLHGLHLVYKLNVALRGVRRRHSSVIKLATTRATALKTANYR